MTDRDVRVRILSEYYDQGSKRAENATRRLAALQLAATREEIAREAQRAAAVAQANRLQADAMTATGRIILGVTAAVAIGMGLATKSAMDWQSAWAGVRKVVDGSPEEMSQLEAELRGLARTLPATHEEIAGVAEAAGQLGVKRQDIADFTRTMINLGETTNLSADQAATSIAQLSNIMGEGADKADEMGSAIVALGNNGASTEQDIVSMGLRIAAAGRFAGMTTDQVLAMASALSSVGLEAEAGGTAVSRVITQINSDVSSGSDRLSEYAHVAGMSAEDFAAAWRDDAAAALTIFINGLGKMQSTGQDATAVLDRLGFADVRVADTLRRAALAGDLLNESLETGSKAWAENNALAEEAAKRYATTEARLQIARNQINDAAIDIGGTFLPVLADAADGVGALAAGFQSLSPVQQEWVTKLGAAAVGLGGLVGGAAVAIPKLAELKTTLDALAGGTSLAGKAIGAAASFLTGPWGLAIAGATIVGALWLKQQGELKQRVDDLTESLDKQTGAVTADTRAKVINQLESAGVLRAAQTLGLELDRVTDAALGSAGAQRYVAEAVDEVNRATLEATNEQYTADLARRGSAADVLTRQLDLQRTVLANSRDEWDRQSAALGTGADASDDARTSTEMLNVELSDSEVAAENASAALDKLTQALDDLNGPALKVSEAQIALQASIDAVTASVEDHKQTLDLDTEAGRANQSALNDLARDGMALATAVLEQTGSVDQFNATLELARQKLAEAAVQTGMTEAAAWAYVDSVLAVPDTATTTAILDTTAAEQKLARFKALLAANNFVITADVRASNPYYSNRADGGWAGPGAPRVAAANGLDRRSMIARGGANILWAEPETGWEAYISGKPSQRDRNVEILGDVASRFGLYVGRMADLQSAPAAAGGGPSFSVSVSADAGLASRYAEAVAERTTTKLRDLVSTHGLGG